MAKNQLTKQISLNQGDEDIIALIQTQENFSAFVKMLCRQHIRNNKNLRNKVDDFLLKHPNIIDEMLQKTEKTKKKNTTTKAKTGTGPKKKTANDNEDKANSNVTEKNNNNEIKNIDPEEVPKKIDDTNQQQTTSQVQNQNVTTTNNEKNEQQKKSKANLKKLRDVKK